MGFLSKLMKNPLVQMALPMALTAVAGPAAGMFGKLPLFSNMSPLMANALKQTALGYGTAALSGSRRPAKAALAAGLTSIPFSYLSAANAANAFNQDFAGTQGMAQRAGTGVTDFVKVPGTERNFFMGSGNQGSFQTPIMPGRGGGGNFGQVSTIAPKYIKPVFDPVGDPIAKITPMDVMLGKTQNISMPSVVQDGKLVDLADQSVTADIFSKPMRDKAGNIMPGEFTTDFLPTAVSQAAGLYAGRDTPEEEFEAAKRRRRKELAFLYGVDESLIEGEMDNPFYQGAFMNTGGIASLDMEMGGDVSGPGGPKDDMIDAKLSDGEFVMTAKAVENFGNGSRMEGAKRMYKMMNKLDPESEKIGER